MEKSRIQKKSMLLYMAEIFAEHPFLLAAAACLFSITFAVGKDITMLGAMIPAAILFLSCIIGAAFISDKSPEKNRRSMMITLSVMSFLISALFAQLLTISKKPQMLIISTGFVLVTAAAIYLAAAKEMNTRRAVLLLFILGFVMRLAYIIAIDIHHKQHDVGSIEDMDGHLGYIAYIAYSLKLPDMDVREVYQFYHPPLHHMIAAAWVRIQNMLGIEEANLWENIQILTLFYSSCCMILCKKIFTQLGLKGSGLVIAMAIICFNPTFYILSGSINNDILSLTFLLGAILNTLYWYKKHTMGRILCISLCIGLSMMTKLSGWMAAPAVAFIFLYVFFKNIKNKDEVKKNLLQFTAFLSTCVPLALWFGIKNLITHGVPLTYVMKLSEKSKQYIGNVPIMQRLFDFSPKQFSEVGVQFKMYKGLYNEYNPLVALFKTSAFDELFTVKYYKDTAGWDKILFWSVVLVGIIGFVGMIFTFVKDKGMNTILKIFTGILYATYFISYYIFCFSFPHVCTENIRYAVPLIVLGAFFFAKAFYAMKQNKNQKTKIVSLIGTLAMTLITVVYSVSSVVFYSIVFR